MNDDRPERIEGEEILCIFRKMTGPHVIAGTERHRTQRVTIEGQKAVCILKKEWRYKG